MRWINYVYQVRPFSLNILDETACLSVLLSAIGHIDLFYGLKVVIILSVSFHCYSLDRQGYMDFEAMIYCSPKVTRAMWH